MSNFERVLSGSGSYKVDFDKRVIFYDGFGSDDRGYNIIDYIIDFVRVLGNVDVIICSDKDKLIDMFSLWSIGSCGYGSECRKQNAIFIDGKPLYLGETSQDGIVLLI